MKKRVLEELNLYNMIITPDFSYKNGTHFAQLSELAYKKSPDEVKRKMAPKG
jgi:hypothetical protein